MAYSGQLVPGHMATPEPIMVTVLLITAWWDQARIWRGQKFPQQSQLAFVTCTNSQSLELQFSKEGCVTFRQSLALSVSPLSEQESRI